METPKDYVNRIYQEAMDRGLCHRQKEFAELLGMNQSTISHLLAGNPKYCTESILRRLRAWEQQVLRREDNTRPAPAQPQRPDIVIPAATMDLYTSMAKSIDRLSELVERLTAGQTAAHVQGYVAPKNYQVK